MSCYSYGCITCGVDGSGWFKEKIVLSGCHDPEWLQRILSNAERFVSAKKAFAELDLCVGPRFSSILQISPSDFDNMIAFLAEHREKGHDLIIIDAQCHPWRKP